MELTWQQNEAASTAVINDFLLLYCEQQRKNLRARFAASGHYARWEREWQTRAA